MPSLDLVIVNWNSGKQLRDCLASVARALSPQFVLQRVVVVDNASTDGSSDGLERIGLPLLFIRNVENRGFAAACNQGAQGSAADYLLFLNPDTLLFEESLTAPLDFLSLPQNASIGIVGIQLLDDDGAIARSCARFPTPAGIFGRMLGLDRLLPSLFPGHFMTDWDHGSSREVDQVIGAFLLVRRTLFEAICGFDERFFVYFEELDFSLRSRKEGWQSFYLTSASAYHKGGGTSEQVKAVRLFYFLRSRILYGFKHFGPVTAAGLLAATLLIEPLLRVGHGALSGGAKSIMETLRGYAMIWRELPAILARVLSDGRRT